MTDPDQDRRCPASRSAHHARHGHRYRCQLLPAAPRQPGAGRAAGPPDRAQAQRQAEADQDGHQPALAAPAAETGVRGAAGDQAHTPAPIGTGAAGRAAGPVPASHRLRAPAGATWTARHRRQPHRAPAAHLDSTDAPAAPPGTVTSCPADREP